VSDIRKDYKRIWFTYKQGLLDEFESICKDVMAIQSKLEMISDIPIQNSMLELRNDSKLYFYKLQGQALVNILMIIDHIGNTSTVANLSPIYEDAFELFGIKGYDYYELPFNKFFEETRTYKEKWEELNYTLVKIIKNMNHYTLVNEESLKCAEEQLAIMNSIEERFEKETSI